MNFEHPIGACLEFKYLIGSEEDASRQLIKNSALDNLISLEKNKIKRYSNFILLILSLLGIASRQSTNFDTHWKTGDGRKLESCTVWTLREIPSQKHNEHLGPCMQLTI